MTARPCATTFTAVIALVASMAPAVAETSCKSYLLGLCTSRYTPAEQARIDAEERLKVLLRNPERAAPELERRLRQQVSYYNGTLLIESPIHDITTFPATIGWSISCYESWALVNFGDTSENGSGVSVDLTDGLGPDPRECRVVSGLLGAAVPRLTRGE